LLTERDAVIGRHVLIMDFPVTGRAHLQISGHALFAFEVRDLSCRMSAMAVSAGNPQLSMDARMVRFALLAVMTGNAVNRAGIPCMRDFIDLQVCVAGDAVESFVSRSGKLIGADEKRNLSPAALNGQ
jgi:hypothetical protein